MPTKKRKVKVKGAKKVSSRPTSKKSTKQVSRSKAKKAKPKKKPAAATPDSIEAAYVSAVEKETRDLFYPQKWTLGLFIKRYSPVIITLLIGLATYFFLVFYLFYPTTLLYGNWFQLLLLLIFIFLIAGMLIYLGLRAELLFIRILSFIFVFFIFTFLLLFILLSYVMQTGRFV
ncbi:MAG: hypothetical protein V1729_01920 [Candidatus Woesearchaeota archaeon]